MLLESMFWQLIEEYWSQCLPYQWCTNRTKNTLDRSLTTSNRIHDFEKMQFICQLLWMLIWVILIWSVRVVYIMVAMCQNKKKPHTFDFSKEKKYFMNEMEWKAFTGVATGTAPAEIKDRNFVFYLLSHNSVWFGFLQDNKKSEGLLTSENNKQLMTRHSTGNCNA